MVIVTSAPGGTYSWEKDLVAPQVEGVPLAVADHGPGPEAFTALNWISYWTPGVRPSRTYSSGLKPMIHTLSSKVHSVSTVSSASLGM